MRVSLMKSQPRISSVRFRASRVRAGVALDSSALSSVTLAFLSIFALGAIFIMAEMVVPALSTFDAPHFLEDIREGVYRGGQT